MKETQETKVWSLGQEDPLEEEMATHSSICAWKILWQRSLVGYSPRSLKELDMTERAHIHVQDLLLPRYSHLSSGVDNWAFPSGILPNRNY